MKLTQEIEANTLHQKAFYFCGAPQIFGHSAVSAKICKSGGRIAPLEQPGSVGSNLSKLKARKEKRKTVMNYGTWFFNTTYAPPLDGFRKGFSKE